MLTRFRAKPLRLLLVALLCGSWMLGCKDQKSDLPTLGQVPSFTLTDHDGKVFTPNELRGKTWVAAFMFTRCPSVCPRITRVMKELQDRSLDAKTDIHWVSFSVDPENDTPEVLKAYGQKHGADLSRWSFLTGPLQSIRETAEQGFKLAFEGKPTEGAEHMGITHGSHLVLVDPQMNIRGYYRTLDDDAQKRLIEDAKSLR